MVDVSAIIVAAGQGSRIGGSLPKQFQDIGGKPVTAHSLLKFEACKAITEIVLIVSEGWLEFAVELARKYKIAKLSQVIIGGKERQDSVFKGLNALTAQPDIVAIHDAVRPFISIIKIEETVRAAQEFGGALVAVPVKDTIKAEKNGFVEKTLDRKVLWAVQTPQTFQFEILSEAYKNAYHKGIYSTDDSALVEMAGHPVKIIEGDYQNMKITVPSDFALAEKLIENN